MPASTCCLMQRPAVQRIGRHNQQADPCCSSAGFGHVEPRSGWQPSRRAGRQARLSRNKPTSASAAVVAPAASETSSSGRDQQLAAIAATPPSLELRFPDIYYDEQGRLMVKNLTLEQLEQWCESIGEDGRKRAMQLWRWMYYDKQWVRCLEDAGEGVQNGFGRAFREKFNALATVDGGLLLQSIHKASDGTRKMVFKLANGPAAGNQVETVLIPVVREQGSKPRITLCVSSQAGCAMNCQFCYTGRMGLQGSLTAAQIVEQAVAARRLLWEEELAAVEAAGEEAPRKHNSPVTNIVYMGMGEPMHNLDAVLPSVDILCQPMGMHFSYNKITVSTVGLIPEMLRFCEESKAVMAVSLHATTDEVRDWIVPVNRRWGLAALVEAMEQLFPKDKAAPRHGHHVLIEYTMLNEVNDTEEDARRLLQLTKNIRCKINLIVFNPHEGSPFKPSTPQRVSAFRNVLIQGGHVTTIRESRGDDQMAACGQLGSPENSTHRPPLLTPPERLRGAVTIDLTA